MITYLMIEFPADRSKFEGIYLHYKGLFLIQGSRIAAYYHPFINQYGIQSDFGTLKV